MPSAKVIAAYLLLSASLLLTAASVQAEAPLRPRIGLVLSGGGARGIAHVGVLKVLDDLHIPVDAIAGTSMGAVIGGLYASGMSAREIETLLRSVNWQDAFRDTPPRADLGFRRKQDDRNFLVRYALGLKNREVLLPKGLVQGQKLGQILRSAAVPVAEVQDFDRLPIPFRAVATDLESGGPVVMSSGDLVTAMRASMSAPGIFAPAERDGHLLVDGGLVDNLPIDIARSMGVDVLIVVDVSFPLATREGLKSPLEITNQAFAIMVRAKTDEALKKLGPADILIQPPLGHTSSVDFGRVEATYSAGVRGAEAVTAALSKYSLSDGAWATYLAGRNPRANDAPKIAFVRVDDESTRYQRLVYAAMQDVVGQPLSRESMDPRMSSLYALDLFESIDYSVVDENGSQGLVFHLKRKSWGPNYVRVGLNIEDDFEGNSRYNAAARFIMTEINSLGGEWLTDLQIGDNPKLSTEFYQPLSSARRYFLAPQLDFEIKNLFALDDNDNRIAEYRVRSYEAGLDLGRELGDWGEVRLGLRRGSGRTTVLVGNPELPVTYFDTGGFFSRFSYDKLDSIYFPRHGQRFEIEWRAERPTMGAEQNVDILSTSWLIARSLGRNTFVFSTDLGATLDSVSSPQYDFTLGGFLNLSGLPPSSLTGPNFGIARFLYYRQIGRGGSGVLNLPVYAGLSLEAGNVWADRHDASFGDLKHDASLFLGADTPLGPLYLGAGFAQGGDTAFYLFLGRTF